MSCWVVPIIAAEIWGISVDHVLQRVRDGSLAHRVDAGFMFVNVAPDGGGGCGQPAIKKEHPPTFTALSAAELEALAGAGDDRASDELPDEETQSPPDDEASAELGDWRAVRKRVGVMRVPPAKPRAA